MWLSSFQIVFPAHSSNIRIVWPPFGCRHRHAESQTLVAVRQQQRGWG